MFFGGDSLIYHGTYKFSEVVTVILEDNVRKINIDMHVEKENVFKSILIYIFTSIICHD